MTDRTVHGFAAGRVLRAADRLIFGLRWPLLALMLIATAVLAWQASKVEVDAGFQKQLPLSHPYIRTFLEYQDAFGGANRVALALIQDEGDIYTERFMTALDAATSAVFFVPGVDRSTVRSLFTPGVRYLQITEDGFASGDVVPRDFKPTPAMLAQVRDNVALSGAVGRLVSGDQTGAMIVAELLEFDPATGERLDYLDVADRLEAIRSTFETDGIRLHVIGFPMIVGAVVDAATEVLLFFAVTLAIIALLLWLYCGSLRLAMLPLVSALVAVIWEFGLLHLFGFGLDPFAVLVPFLVLAIGVSHGVQMVNAWVLEQGVEGEVRPSPLLSARKTFLLLAIPGTVALITDVIGFATIYLIDIDIIQEMAINAVLGIAAIILSNKLLLPILLSFTRLPDPAAFARKQAHRSQALRGLWSSMAVVTSRPVSLAVLALSGAALAWSLWAYPKLEIGDLQTGVPELRPDARYNQDARAIAGNFAAGVDQMQVIVEAPPESCINHGVLSDIDQLTWRLQNTPGVLSASSVPTIARRVAVGSNQGDLRWTGLPRNQYVLAAATRAIPSSAGLANPGCTALVIRVDTADHRADTIDRVIGTVQAFEPSSPDIRIRLAGGNLGVMAATNAVISEQEKTIVLWVYAVLIVFIWLFFRSWSAVFCAVLPLALTTMLTYAFMATVGIGLKVATLPIVALGVGIGVDDSLYLLSVLRERLRAGEPLRAAWAQTLARTGRAVVFTSIVLAAGVTTWLWSGLQFQADMGLLLVFMFVVNLFGAVVVLPALATWLVRPGSRLGRRPA